jgi:hypothetical protein
MNDPKEPAATDFAKLLDLLNASDDFGEPIPTLANPSPGPAHTDPIVPVILSVPEQAFVANDEVASLDDLETRFASYVGAAMLKSHDKE